MRCSNQGRFRQQVRFLQRQFLQEGDLPFTDVLSADIVLHALAVAGVVWKDRIYTPLTVAIVNHAIDADAGRFPGTRQINIIDAECFRFTA